MYMVYNFDKMLTQKFIQFIVSKMFNINNLKKDTKCKPNWRAKERRARALAINLLTSHFLLFTSHSFLTPDS